MWQHSMTEKSLQRVVMSLAEQLKSMHNLEGEARTVLPLRLLVTHTLPLPFVFRPFHLDSGCGFDFAYIDAIPSLSLLSRSVPGFAQGA
jgi:hypothetical protein